MSLKILLLFLIIIFFNIFSRHNSFGFEPGSYYSLEGLRMSLSDIENKDKLLPPRRNLVGTPDSIYIEYCPGLFRQMDFEDSIVAINEFIDKYPDNKYADDCLWLKGQIYKNHLHRYKDYLDVCLNMIEKYGDVKLDYWKGNVVGIPDKITKEKIKSEIEEIKSSLNEIELLKGGIREERQKKDVNEEKIINYYLKIGTVFRKYYDFDNAEKNYLEGIKELSGNERSAEIFYKMGEMFSKDIFLYMKFQINVEISFEKNFMKYDYKNDQFKKALEYYLEIYKRYPKSKLSPKALEEVGTLYTIIGTKWKYYSDEQGGPSYWSLSEIDYKKAIEMYEKIVREYPEYEGIKGVLGKLGRALEKLKDIGEISEIEYFKKDLETEKEYIKYMSNEPEWEIQRSRRYISQLEEVVKKIEDYKSIYNEYPKIDNYPSNYSMDLRINLTINKINGLMKQKQEKGEIQK